MVGSSWSHWIKLLVITTLVWGCTPRKIIQPYPAEYIPPPPPPAPMEGQLYHPKTVPSKKFRDLSWTKRIVTEQEIIQVTQKNPELTSVEIYDILANLNARARYYIREDVKNHRPLKVPNSFSSYKNWSPLPQYIPDLTHVPKFILITMDKPYLGWYQYGHLKNDSFVCIGKEEGMTEAGFYRVLNKDANHVSRSYPNAFGDPAPMPWALRIYDHVWIHLGDITSGNCSHGCINLPLGKAEELYKWADLGTIVVVADSLPHLNQILKARRNELLPGVRNNRMQGGVPTSDR